MPENDSIEGKFGWKQTLVKALLSKILKSLISEIWAVQLSIGAQPWLEQHVILLADGSHLCTCLMLINKGIICSHFIKVLTKSTAAFFNISLIPSRWYGDQVAQFFEDEIRTSPLIQLCNVQNKSIQTSIQTDFLYLSDIRGGNVFTPILKEVVSKRQQYAKAHELQKKAYNLATRIGQESEYINLLKNFIHTGNHWHCAGYFGWMVISLFCTCR